MHEFLIDLYLYSLLTYIVFLKLILNSPPLLYLQVFPWLADLIYHITFKAYETEVAPAPHKTFYN